jgi:hypothetical protein
MIFTLSIISLKQLVAKKSDHTYPNYIDHDGLNGGIRFCRDLNVSNFRFLMVFNLIISWCSPFRWYLKNCWSKKNLIIPTHTISIMTVWIVLSDFVGTSPFQMFDSLYFSILWSHYFHLFDDILKTVGRKKNLIIPYPTILIIMVWIVVSDFVGISPFQNFDSLWFSTLWSHDFHPFDKILKKVGRKKIWSYLSPQYRS